MFSNAILTVWTLTLLLTMPALAQFGSQGLVFHGVVTNPDGSAMTEPTSNFVIEIIGKSSLRGDGTPGADSCVLYTESQVGVPLNQGRFAVTVGDGTGVTFGTGVSKLEKLFVNPPTTLSGGTSHSMGAINCSSGQSAFQPDQPNSLRYLRVVINTPTASIDLLEMPIRSAPFAHQAKEIDGYDSMNIVKIGSSNNKTYRTMTGGHFNFLVDLFDGTSIDAQNRELKNISTTGTDPNAAANVNYVNTHPINPSQLPDVVTPGTVGTANSATQVTVDSKGRVTALVTTPIAIDSTQLISTPADNGKVLVSTGSTWTPQTLTGSMISGVVTSITGTTGITVTGGTTAAPSVGLTATGVTAGTYTQVTVDMFGRVTAASSPTSLAGYGITDAVQNAGGTPSIQSGTFAARPATATTGALYVSTDTGSIYSYNGGWTLIAAAANGIQTINGAGGLAHTIAITNAPGALAVNTLAGAHTINIPTANGATTGLLSSADWTTFNNKFDATITAPVANHVVFFNGTQWVNGPIPAAALPNLAGDVAGPIGATVIQPNAVTTLKIADSAVTTAKIADDAVTTVKIADNNVTFAKTQDIQSGKILGRTAAGPGDIQEMDLISGTGVTVTPGPTGFTINATATGLSNINNNEFLANTSGASNLPVGTTFTGFMDSAISNAPGSIIYRSGAGWVALPPGTNSQILSLTAGMPAWTNNSAVSAVTGSNGIASSGGATPDITMAPCPIDGQVRKYTLATGTWDCASSVGAETDPVFTSFATTPRTANLVYAGPTTGSAAASFRTLDINDIRSSIGGGTFLTGAACGAGQALTYDSVTDTISCNTISVAATAITGILPIANGGTNSGTALNNNRIMVSNGGAIVEAAALTDGQLLIGSTGAAPVAANLLAGPGVAIANGAGSITISATGTGIQSLNGDGTPIQTFANGTAGTAPAFATAAGVHTLNIPMAATAGVTAGLISNADYTNFNTKVTSVDAASTNTAFTITGGPITTSGTLTLNTPVQAAGTVFAAPVGGGAPIFRALTAADLPAITLAGDVAGPVGATLIQPNAVTTGKIADGNVTYAKIQNISGSRILGRYDLAAGAAQEISLGAGLNLDSVTGVLSASGTGLQSLNGLSGATQTFATGTVGTDFAISSAGSVHTFNLPTASATNRGALSSADWTTFNNKVTSVSGSGIVNVTAGTTPVVSLNGIADGSILANTSGGSAAPTAATLTAGAGVTISKSPGAITIAATGLSPLTTKGDIYTHDGTAAARQAVGTDGQLLVANSATATGLGWRNLNISDVKSSVAGNWFAASGACPAGQTLSYSSVSDSVTCAAFTATAFSGVLPIANGGTNSSAALNNNRIMVSSGGSIVEAPALANGQLLIGSTGAAPVAANITAGTGVTITNAAGSITIAATGTGIQSLNGDGTPIQTFANGTAGTAPAFATAGGVHTLNIPMATTAGVTAGLISNADYANFNSKVSSVTVTAPITNTGTAAAPIIGLSGDFAAMDITNIGSISMNSNENIRLGNYATDPTGLTAADKGRTWFNSTTNQIKYWDGSAVVVVGVSGAGLTNLNGLTIGSQTFATGTAGTDFAISSAGSVHTFNLPTASAANRGALSSADWTAFNNKFDATITTPALNQVVYYNGTQWVNGSIPAAALPNLAGDVAGPIGATVIQPNAVTTGKIADTNVTYAKIQNISGSRILGRYNAAAGVAQEISLGAGLSLDSGTGVLSASGTGIQSLNGATNATQSFGPVGTVGVAPAFSTDTGTGVHTLNVPLASTLGVTAGLISNTDYLNFSGKVSSVAAASNNTAFTITGGPITSSGTLTLNTPPQAAGTVFAAPAGGGAPIFRALTSADLPGITLSGDVTGDTSATVVGRIQGRTVAATAPAAGQVLAWNNLTSQWEPTANAASSAITSLTGDVTATGPGAAAATIANNAVTTVKIANDAVTTVKILDGNVTYAKIQNISGSRILGRYNAAAGVAQEISLGAGLSLDAGTGVLSASGTGIQSLNGATNATQSFGPVGTAGVAPAFSTNTTTGVHSLNIPSASTLGVTAGLISNADYLNFSGKVSSVTVTAPITNTGSASAPIIGLSGDFAAMDITNIGSISMNTNENIRLGNYVTDPTGLTAADKGRTWFNSTTNQIKYWDGTAVIVVGVSGAGLTNLNGLTLGTQTFAAGTAGTDFAISSTGSVHTFNLPTASAANRGALSSADWTTFNNKVTSVSGSGIVNVTAGTTPTVSLNGIADGSILANTSGSSGSPTAATLTAGAGVTISKSPGAITIAATGLSPLTSKGDIYTHDGTAAARQAVGANGQMLVANSATATGLNWRNLNITDIKSSVAGNWFNVGGACPAGQTLSYSAVSDSVICAAFTATAFSGVLPIANGGTNSSTALNNNRIMVSSGGSIVEAPALANGQLLIGSTGAAPVAANLTAGTGVTITNAAGSITIAASGTGIQSLNGATNATQSFGPVGTAGVAPAFSTNTGTGVHSLNIPMASSLGVTAGLISNADYLNFSGKVSSVTVTAPITNTGSASAPIIGLSGDFAAMDITNIGSISMNTNENLRLGNYVTDPTGLTAADKGRTWFNSTTNQIKYWDGTAIIVVGVSGAGLTNLNGLTLGTQTFATGTAGSDFAISSAGSVHTFNLPTASAANRGALSSADWTTFNNKVTSVSGSGIVNVTAGTTPTVSLNGIADGSILANTSGGTAAPTAATLTAGAGVTISKTPGAITISATGTGVQSLNGATNATQSFGPVGTIGVAPAFSTNTGTGVHSLNIPMASSLGVTAGLISNADYLNFSGKVSSVAAASNNTAFTITGGPITSAGTLTLNTPPQANGTIFAAPAGGGAPIFRTLTATDLPAITLAGDVTGATGANSVVRIQNRNVAATAPTAGQVLAWNNILSQWEPTANAASSAITSLNGDVTATGPGAVTATISNNAVTTPKIADGAVTTVKIANDAVTTVKIANDAVTTAKILNSNVTYAKIQNISGQRILGRFDSAAGIAQEISLGVGLNLNPTTGVLSASGTGIQSLNGATNATQSFGPVGTVGVAPAFSTNTGTGVHSLNIPMASSLGVTAGLISNLDYANFNSKVSSVAAASNNTAFTITGGPITSAGTLTLNTPPQANGTVFAAPAGGGAPIFRTLTATDLPAITLGGDVTGTTGANSVVRIQNRDVASTAPTAGQVLAWNNALTRWEPQNNPGANAWALTGNSGISAANFLGTTDAQPLSVRTNNIARMTVLSTGEVGIGTATPAGFFHAAGTTPFYVDRANGANGSNLVLRSSNGSIAAPTATALNDMIGRVTFVGHTGSGYGTTLSGIRAHATQAWTTTAQGSRLVFATTADNSATQTDQMTLDQNGNLGIGTATPGAKLDVNGTIRITGGAPGVGKVLGSDATGLASWVNAATGTVTSVGIAVPSYMTATPAITTSGNITLDFSSQAARTFFAAPTAAAGAPSFRTMVAADLPSFAANRVMTTSATGALQATNCGLNQVISFDATGNFVCTSLTAIGGVTLGGDVTGASGTNTVVRIQGRNVASTAPTNGQVLAWNNALTRWEPANDAGSNAWVIGGNAPAATSSIGSTNATGLDIITGGLARIQIGAGGGTTVNGGATINGGVTVAGGANISGNLVMNATTGGQIVGRSVASVTALPTSYSWNNGNTQYTSQSCTASAVDTDFTFNNAQDGAAYFFIVKGTTSGACSFAFPGFTVRYPPDCNAGAGPCTTTAGRHTVFNMAVAGTDVYISWTPGY